ncbi:alpha/beta fold hydrolase [Halosolutus gelatinilyticus]|uniref:alpha/beta fold hydrolase n=1 Tax=Halosolutus gelatinilyticus TaxID=2931975 RepID=UPI001FF54964|nr:alpha/beta hydrolase [Halosolutus gelatinilyticus]
MIGDDDGIYRSKRGERRLKSLYETLLGDLDADFDRRFVETRFGETHVLAAGPEDAPPVVVFHGGNVVNPISLSWFLPLADEFRLYAPDTIGHPGFSAQTRLSPRDDSYGTWACDILDGLGLDRVPMLGPSYGGGIVLRTAAFAPDRISRAGLVVPAGLGTGSIRRLLVEIVLPMLAYRLAPDRSRLRRAVQPMFTEPAEAIDETILDVVGAVFDEVKLERSFPKTATPDELAGFDAPTLLAVAERDLFFPPDVVVPRAKRAIRNLEVVVRLKGESHFPGPGARDELRALLRKFLTGDLP